MVQILLALIPTILFILIVLWGFLLGLGRGLRKSIILLIQATVAFLIALTFYLIVVNNQQSDAVMVGIVNNFMGPNGIQNAIGVSSEADTVTKIITEVILKYMNYGEGLTLALQENANYLATLINFIYHLVFFFIALLLYDVLLFLFYLIYVIFYPERRHKEKKEKKELELNSDYKYKKRALWGGLVGFLRGFVVAFIYMSFIGATLFMIGGGIGDKKYDSAKEYDFGSDTGNRLYEVYEALGSYGNHGIFKILNVAKNQNEVPYYYFAANMVLCGNLTDEKFGINENIYFAEEIGQYTRLVRDTFDLMMETDSATMIALFNKEINTDDDRIFAILADENFQKGFAEIIKKFDGGKYFINFGLSMLDSIAYHLDKMDFINDLDANTREILLVLLKNDHYSEYIPDDKTKQNSNQKVDTLYLSQMIVKDDIDNLLNSVLKLLGLGKNATTQQKLKVYSESLIPALKKLSILNKENAKSESINKVLERLFVCIDNMYNIDETNNLTVERLELLASTSVNVVWIDEIQGLLDTLISGCSLLSNVNVDFTKFQGDNVLPQIINILIEIFHGENKVETTREYDEIVSKLKSSKILDKILSISFINQQFIKSLDYSNSDVYIPENIVFADNNGEPGELSCFLDALKLMMKNQENADILLNLMDTSTDMDSRDRLILLSSLVSNLNDPDESGNTATKSLAKSEILQVIITGLIIMNHDLGGIGEIYLPESVLVNVDGEIKLLIKQDEIEGLLSVLPSALDLITDYLGKPEGERRIDDLIDGLSDEILDNIIIEGTISNIALNTLSKTDYIKIPNDLLDVDNWLSKDGNPGELKNIISATLTSGLVIQDVINGGIQDSIDTLMKTLNNVIPDEGITKIEKICKSGILYLTLSNALDTALPASLVDPKAKEASKEDINGDTYYKMSEIKALVDVISSLELRLSNIDISEITNNISNLNQIPEGKTESKLDTLYKSIIARSMLYVKLNELINSNEFLVDSNECKELIPDTDVTIYKKVEISSLITFFRNIGASALDNISSSSFSLNDDLINNVGESNILTATISKNLTDKNLLTIKSTDYDLVNNHIKPEELVNLLQSVKNGLGITDVSTFDSSSIMIPTTDSKINALLNSNIMLATISNMISSADSDIYVSSDTDKSEKTKSYIDEDIIVISKNELSKFITGIGVLSKDGTFEIEITNEKLKSLSEDDLNKALDSSILHIILSNYIISLGYPILTTDKIDMDVYDVSTKVASTIEVVKKESIKAFVAMLI